ncbi:MAG: type III polyketide synthase [Bacteroidota bacterium]
MADIVSIATASPPFAHKQVDILQYMQKAYQLDADEKRKLAFLYHHSGIETRHSAIPDYGDTNANWNFLPKNNQDAFPSIDQRMELYKNNASVMSIEAIKKCIASHINSDQITHLITISCTGMSAPGLDLEIMEAMQLSPSLFRTSINFMGCYAAIHGLKMAKFICDSEPDAQVVLVATELCTIHFQKEYSLENASSSLLFADGSAAVLVSNNSTCTKALQIESFHSQVAFQGKNDMAWEISSKGFLMTLSSYIPQIIKEDIDLLINAGLEKKNLTVADISYWCIHPGGKKIVDVIEQKLSLTASQTKFARKILAENGNMSSPTILFVLKEIMDSAIISGENVFGIAFGPGLTMETFLCKKK